MLDRAWIESYYHTYNSGDSDALITYYHPDVELTSAQGVISGAQAIIDTYQFITARFIDHMRPEAIAIDGNIAVVDIFDEFTAKIDVDDFMGRALAAGDSFHLHLRGTYVVHEKQIHKITLELLG